MIGRLFFFRVVIQGIVRFPQDDPMSVEYPWRSWVFATLLLEEVQGV